jgi:membrane-bound inhibitor of C-type lysozyme
MKPIQYFLPLVAAAMLAVALPSYPSLAQEELACESDVIVQEGDWLSTIAEQAYGDPTLYPAIAFATNLKAQSDSSYATIDSHDIVEPGWKLCLPEQVVAEELEIIAPVDTTVITVDALINGTYSGIYEAPVTLTEGRYEGEPFDEGGASRPIVEYISEIFGDLDGDGVEDAAVFLVESGGGTGNFIYVAAQLNQNGQPVDAGAVWIEDRVQVKSAAIENGQISLEITAEGPGDAACCKSHKTNTSYALQDGLLAEILGEEQALERISAADLNGTSWTLLELDYDQPALVDTEVTISFADGQITGFGGCNNYNSNFTLGDDNPFVMSISPVVATRQACPEPILDQETAYFSALENVSLWGYDIGRLAMNYFEDPQGGPRRLLFVPAMAESSQLEMLTASPWQWISFTDPVQQFDVEQPQNYTLTFQPDGTLQIKADCNQVGASYNASEEGALSIQPGPATLAACPPESRGDEFVQNLSFAAGYFFQDGNLYIDMMADGGTLKLSPQATAPEMAAEATVFTYQCDAGKSFTAEFTNEGPDGSVNLALDGQTLTLPRVPSGSGAKYSDGQTTFWTQGDEGFVEVNGKMTYQNCVTQAN